MSIKVIDSASETTTKVLTVVDKATDFIVVGTMLATSGLIMERRTQVVEQEETKAKQDAGKKYSKATQAKLDLLDQDIPA